MYLRVRAARPWMVVFAFLFALTARGVAAQETGKVQGRVTDAASGQPIAGAQISIAGTRQGNITNPEGYYFINNVPAGVHDFTAQFIGYQSVTVRQQRVLSGQTITLDFKLTQSAVQIAALEIIGETQPLVPRDQVASKNIVTGQAVQDLPVDNVNQIITLQPGVVGGVGKGFSIRGGRSGEEAVFVDGVLVRNFNAGTTRLTVGTNSLSEVDVLTGGFSAEFGEAQSGIINYVTRSGGRAWNGALSLQTDEIMPKEWSHGFNRAELSFGGPLMGGLGFFFAGTATGNRSANFGKGWRDVPLYIAQGVDTTVTITQTSAATGQTDTRTVVIPNFVEYNEGGRIPFSNSDEYTFDAKLDYSYGSGSRIFITGKTSRAQGRTAFGGGLGSLYNPREFSGARNRANTAILGWTHNFVQSAEQALALDFKVALQHDRGQSGILDPQFDLDNRNPALGFTFDDFKFVVEEDAFPINQAFVEKWLRNETNITPFPTDRSDLRLSQEFRLNPYGAFRGFRTTGLGGTFGFNDETQLQLRGTVDWQVNRENRLKIGVEHFNIHTRLANIGYQTAAFGQVWDEKPRRSAIFVQDRLDLGDLVVEGGLRYDRFDPNTNFPVIPGYYDLDDPTTYEKAKVRSDWSPRLGVSFPVTVNSTFRLSYGHFTQLPDLNEYYLGKNTDFFRYKNTNTNDFFARPLEMGKTIAFEFGYRQLISQDFVFDISAYNRDKQRDVTFRKLSWEDPTNCREVNGVRQCPTTYLNTATNADFGNIRGVDMRLDRRFGQVFDAMLGYSYQDARNTGTDPFTYLNIFARVEGAANALLGLPPNPAQAIRATEENRKHNFTGNFQLRFPSNYETSWLRNTGVFGTARFVSGLAYTPLDPTGTFLIGAQGGLGTSGATLRDDEMNTARLPWQKTFDLRATKGLRLMGWNAQLFVDARNIFDFDNRTGVWATSGDVVEERVFERIVESDRDQLGGGTAVDVVDLSSLAAAGSGVRNEVDLILLRRAEARFGDGNGEFTREEQERAFRALVDLQSGPQIFTGVGRRVRLGFEITF